MVRNIRLLIAFDGTNYSGWQRQKNAPTIQGEIERCLSIMTGTEITLHSAGRTDAGVHAMAMVANFKTGAAIPGTGFCAGLNSMLAPDIRILAADEVPGEFHSRYCATGKTYRYTLFVGEIQLPTKRLYAAHYPHPLDQENINRALRIIVGTHDFTSFEGSGSRDNSTVSGRGAVRTLYHAEFSPCPSDHDTCSFRFTGNGFLRHMVRNLVGTLLEVGRGRMTIDEFQTVVESRDRRMAGPTAPACGLTLEHVLYDSITP